MQKMQNDHCNDHHIVVKHNNLIQETKYRLTAQEHKFVSYAISLIQPGDAPLTRYTISIEDFANLCGVTKHNAYVEFRKMTKSIASKAEYILDEETGDMVLFSWFIEPSYNKGKGTATLMFSPRVQKYLFDLKKYFTQYELKNVMSLSSKYSIRIYELLKSYEYMGTIIVPIEKFREIIHAENYKSAGNLRQRVLDVAIPEINDVTDICVTVDYLDRSSREINDLNGKTVKALRFSIIKKAS